MEVKICGLTKPEEALYLNEVKADYAGFVFYPKSKRNLDIAKANEIMRNLDSSIKKVAVMVSPDASMIKTLQESDFDILQIHKELSLEVLACAKLPIWYAVNISDEDEMDAKICFLSSLSDDLNEKIEAIVVDAPNFGSGKPFNWKKSKRLKKAGAQSPPDNIFANKRFILAGGLNKDNVAEGIRIFNPDVVDVSSGVENANGKDRDLIIEFVNASRNA